MGATLNGRQVGRLVTRERGAVAGRVAKRQKIRTGAGKVDPPLLECISFPHGVHDRGGWGYPKPPYTCFEKVTFPLRADKCEQFG